MNKKCNTDFRVKKTDLMIEMPTKKKATKKKTTKKTTKKVTKNGKKDQTDSKAKAGSETVEQQD